MATKKTKNKLIGRYIGVPSPYIWNPVNIDNSFEIPCTNPELIMGVEIEVERCALRRADYEEQLTSFGYMVKTDGSLREVDGYPAHEFITSPTPLKYLIRNLTNFFDTTGFSEENFSDRCSIHVHVNCTDLTFSQLSSVALIYTVLESVLFKFVNNRTDNPYGWSRDTNLYCVPWNQCRDHYGLILAFLNNPNQKLAVWQKYTALNLLPLLRFGTIEFRHMHGTSDMEKITKWLNMIGAIFRMATSEKFETIEKQIITLNSTSQYESFFHQALGQQLPYTPEYAMLLEEGIILAKYSLSSSRAHLHKEVEETEEGVPGSLPVLDQNLLDRLAAARDHLNLHRQERVTTAGDVLNVDMAAAERNMAAAVGHALVVGARERQNWLTTVLFDEQEDL